MSFYTSLNGLKNAQSSLGTIAHNIANLETYGFKRGRTEFAEIVAGSALSNPRTIQGIGSSVEAITQNFSLGPIEQTGSALDLAITGDGFFTTRFAIDDAEAAYAVVAGGVHVAEVGHGFGRACGSGLLKVLDSGRHVARQPTRASPVQLAERDRRRRRALTRRVLVKVDNVLVRVGGPVDRFDLIRQRLGGCLGLSSGLHNLRRHVLSSLAVVIGGSIARAGHCQRVPMPEAKRGVGDP